MKRAPFLLIALLFAVAPLRAQEHGNVTRPEPPAPKWFSYTSPEGRYIVFFSEQPKLTSQNITAASGDNLVQYMASASVNTGVLMVGYFDYPSNVVFSLDEARNGMVKSLQGTLVEEQSISLGGAPGRSLKIAARTETGFDFMDRARFYDVNRRIYVLQCLFPKSDDNESAAQTCEQFFDSFRVKTSPN